MEEPVIEKKKSRFIGDIKKQSKAIVMILVSILVIAIGSSYALLRNSQVGNNSYTINAGNLEVTFKDQETDALTISNMYPMTDTEGLTQTDELTFVVKNTGNIPAVYNVYIEETSTSPAFKTVIRYVDKKNSGEYSDVKVLNDNKYIDEKARLEVNAEATYKVKLWLAEEADATYMNKTFRAKIVVDVMQDFGSTLLNDIYHPKNTSCTNYVEEDGITYISGSKDCIDFNYVWWSGKMWRITAIYPDGAMKMVTDNMITSIAFGENVTYYNKSTEEKSYMFQWLNEDFLDTLYNQGADVIDTTKSWNATMPPDTNMGTKPLETDATMIPTTISPIGLLNSYEYYKSYQNTTSRNGYLNIGYYWWLLNLYSSSNVWVVNGDGNGANNSPTISGGSRPSVYLKSGISLLGSGTKESPYRLSDDYDEANTDDKVYTRHSGEYIKFDTDGSSGNYDNAQLFRIVGVEGEENTRITKIVAMDYAANKTNKKFASTDTFGASANTQSSDYWDYYLNNDWYNNLSFKEKITNGTYYIGTVGIIRNYKLAVCSTTGSYTTAECLSDANKRVTTTFTGNIGLLRYGEIFATQQGSGSFSPIEMWLITKFSPSNVWCISEIDLGNTRSITSMYGVRTSYYLKSDVKILSGSGTELDPYIVS